MGQREGFAESDLIRINRRYCGGQNPGQSGLIGGNGNPSYIDYTDNGIAPNYPNYGGFPMYPQGPPFGGQPQGPQFVGPPNNAYPPPNPYPQPQRPPRPFRPFFRPSIFG